MRKLKMVIFLLWKHYGLEWERYAMEWDYWFEMCKTITEVLWIMYTYIWMYVGAYIYIYIRMNIYLLAPNCLCRQSSWKATCERLLLIRGDEGRSMQSWKRCWLWHPASLLPSCHCAPVSGLGCQPEAPWAVSPTLGPSNTFPPAEVSFQPCHRNLFVGSVSFTVSKSLRVMIRGVLLSSENDFV